MFPSSNQSWKQGEISARSSRSFLTNATWPMKRVWKLFQWHLLPLWSPWTLIPALDRLVWSLFLHVDMIKKKAFFFFTRFLLRISLKISAFQYHCILTTHTRNWKEKWIQGVQWSVFRYFYVIWKGELQVAGSNLHHTHLTKKSFLSRGVLKINTEREERIVQKEKGGKDSSVFANRAHKVFSFSLQLHSLKATQQLRFNTHSWQHKKRMAGCPWLA